MNRRTETSALLTSNTTSFAFANEFFTGTSATTGFTAGEPSVTINPRNLGTGEFYEVTSMEAN